LQSAQPPVHIVREAQSQADQASNQSKSQQRHSSDDNSARSANEVIFHPAHPMQGIEGD